MSYDIVRSIKVDDEKKSVTITAAANNVTPRYYTAHEASYFAEIWKEKGKEAVEIELVKAFESGNFQGGASKYQKAATRLRRMKAYQEFNWRCGGLGDEYTKVSDNRRERVDEFDALVLKALKTKEPKTKFVIKADKPFYGEMYFYARANARTCRWWNEIKKAKVFTTHEEAEGERKCWRNSEDWEVLQIA